MSISNYLQKVHTDAQITRRYLRARERLRVHPYCEKAQAEESVALRNMAEICETYARQTVELSAHFDNASTSKFNTRLENIITPSKTACSCTSCSESQQSYLDL